MVSCPDDKKSPHRPDDPVADGLKILDPVFLRERCVLAINTAIERSTRAFTEYERAVLIELCVSKALGTGGMAA